MFNKHVEYLVTILQVCFSNKDSVELQVVFSISKESVDSVLVKFCKGYKALA